MFDDTIQLVCSTTFEI